MFICTHTPIRINEITFCFLLLKFCCLLCINVIKPACIFPCSSPLWQGGGSVFLQQINISTHVSGPSTHHTGWKLLQSFLWRKEMMPNQPRESGITQNNGVIEDHWGESLPVWLWARASHWCPLAWRPHSRDLFPLRHGCDLIQLNGLQNTPPFNHPTSIHTLHLCVFYGCHSSCGPSVWLAHIMSHGTLSSS